MTFNFDSRHLPHSLPDWDRLVSACAQPDDTIETHWLERKGLLDLTTARHRFAVARAILAFANRDDTAAGPFIDGHALVVIGISTDGTITGIPRIEDHQLLKALQPYLGQDERSPRWIVHRHRVNDTHDVLIIDVSAPRPGDPLFTLRKAYDNSYAGTIFTRPSTESEPADPTAVAMLSRRLTARTKDFEVEVTLNHDAITRYAYDASFLEPLLKREFDHYWQDVPHRPKTAQTPIKGLGSQQLRAASAAFEALNRSPQLEALRSLDTRHEETRAKEEFWQELEGWTDQVRNCFPDLVLDVLAVSQPVAVFTVTNTCGRFLEDLEIEVHIEGDVIQHPKPFEVDDIDDRLPHRPRKWGPWFTPRFNNTNFIPAASYSRPLATSRSNSTDFRNSGSVTATLSCDALRPGRSHTFTDDDDHRDVVLLTSNQDMPSARITITATARGIDDAYTTTFNQPVSATVDLTKKLEAVIHALKYFKAPAPRDQESI